MAASAEVHVPTQSQPVRTHREKIFYSGNGVSVYMALNAVGREKQFQS